MPTLIYVLFAAQAVALFIVFVGSVYHLSRYGDDAGDQPDDGSWLVALDPPDPPTRPSNSGPIPRETPGNVTIDDILSDPASV